MCIRWCPPERPQLRPASNALSLINTIQSVTGIDLDTFVPNPYVAGKSVFGGYCGPAVKPIALKMLATISQDPVTSKVPVSGIGGVSTRKDAVEFMLLGATTVQVCTAAMKHGFRIVEDMCEGLNNWMDEKGFKTIDDFVGKSVPHLTQWEELDINYHIVANIDQEKCIHCGLCYIACEDGSASIDQTCNMAGRTILILSRKMNVLAVICVSLFARLMIALPWLNNAKDPDLCELETVPGTGTAFERSLTLNAGNATNLE